MPDLLFSARSLWRCLVGSVVLGVLVSVVAGCASSASPAAPGSDLLTESDETLARKRARIRLELAVGYYNNGQTTIALDELKQSIAADPTLLEAHNLRGLIYMRLNDASLAEESFRKALQINPQASSVQHNLGWMLCQQGRMVESNRQFLAAIAEPSYVDKAKSWMTMGVCQAKAGQAAEAEASLQRAYELDASSPVTGYNLALVLFQRAEYVRSQFYIRRINNGDLANAESLWLGIKVEQRLGNRDAVAQLGAQLRKRFPQSKELGLFERGAFDE
ncbi:MAG: type IV pilus biogenesis/stability protein PilW [Curvibacter sp. RIFCSPHIGHO2_12_FULL_63_18]|uniref:type IV pilus biogenesis/stability protein PilW n=1 Tax=Rhodoferax sp. TaxID=50421 RepID=UPI0008CE309F|nr:type IV pilus biogenesis/stability protein PilW [Rhodoferax sp.]OGO96673.1 MAG: type IV pilus biogenesis/stability protein PilW [Curvibacter sp. GWA2_63_95]OGO98556.1 MAG: type IV pilus biogenesis/stability protein PilW [Curvibacter sp. RIFCSPHIGHO2_12_FULL_63_18]HCX82650.1 type IV pilus biogenesis/stability protein PilW [Rhodoferax sp.]